MQFQQKQLMTSEVLLPLSDNGLPAAAGAAISQPTPKRKWKYQPTKVKFDPKKHLDIGSPSWKKTMKDFGYEKHDGISDFAAAEPFRMFSDEAIRLIRNDILSEPVQENHVICCERNPYMLRGYAHKHTPFIYEACTHPSVLKAISDVVGIDLVHVHDYEVGHTNIQLGHKGREGVRELSDTPTLPLPPSERLEPSQYDNRMVDDWHFDQVPFVAVLMLSDTNGMEGGETAVMARDGTRDVVPGPSFGKVAVLQGSKVKHAALRALNCPERITLVLSLRPRDVFVEDSTNLSNGRDHDDWDSVGKSWLDYRFQILEERCRLERERLRSSDEFDKDEVIKFCKSQINYFEFTARELFPDFE